jgi:hypothetical protein
MTTSTREKRDWTLLIFIIPIGIIFMLIAGQVAIRLVPSWSINAGMQSNLDPNNLPMQQNGLVQPILPAILTPLGWFDTFLTPGADSGDEIAFPPFVIFEPTSTPVVTASPPPTDITQPPTVPVTDTPIVTASPPVTATKPPVEETPTSPSASPTASPTTSPTSIPTGYPTSPPPAFTAVTPPAEIGVGTPPPPDGIPGLIDPGTYTVIDLGTGVVVSGTADSNYDLILYEALVPLGTGTSIQMDQMIIGISNDPTGSSFYEVFYWGDNEPDENTNVDFNNLPADSNPLCTEDECDNRVIQADTLYPDPAGTGILIDVDNVPSQPPPATYRYIVIISPPATVYLNDPVQVDSIVVAEVDISSVSGLSVQPANNVPDQPVEKAPDPPPAEEAPPPAEEAPDPPAEEAPEPPLAEEAPAVP